MALSGSFIIPRTSGTEYLQGRVAWSATQNVINNTSTITAKLIFKRTNTGYETWGTGNFNLTVNGSTTRKNSQSYSFTSSDKTVISSTTTITHNSDGTKSFSISASYSGDSPIGGSGTQSFTLNKIDRTTPTITLSAGTVTASSIPITVTSSVSCDTWQISTNNGSSYTTFSSSSGTNKSYTITGLTPNTAYQLKARARKVSNQVTGTSSTVSKKTLGGSLLNSISNIVADINTDIIISFNATVYDTKYTHTLTIGTPGSSNINPVLFTFTGKTLTNGANSITLSSTQKTQLQNSLTNKHSSTVLAQLTTYSGSTQIGNTSQSQFTLSFNPAASSPVNNGFTFYDFSTTTAQLTGNNQVQIQGRSALMFNFSAATPKNGASIALYQVVCSHIVKTSTTPNNIMIGAIAETGSVQITGTVIDSRGFKSSVTQKVTVLAYEDVEISIATLRRINEVEAATQVVVNGSISPLVVNGVQKNLFKQLSYRFKKTSENTYGSWANITSLVTLTDTDFDFENNEWIDFDPDFSYNIQFQAKDQLTTDRITITLPQGIPLISFRKKMLGVNNKKPIAALDVVGQIFQNGSGIQGNVATMPQTGANADLNNTTTAGIYFQPNTPLANNYPTLLPGLLEIFNFSGTIIQRYTTLSSPYIIYWRCKANNGSWISWQSI